MRIIFVRHGKPDYANDCLTPEGHKQAAVIAERLSGEGVREIYVAPSGRAQQTAACTAQRLGIKAVTLSFMGEISWGGPGIPSDGRPWELGYRHEGRRFLCLGGKDETLALFSYGGSAGFVEFIFQGED